MDLWVRSISKRILLKVDNILVVEAENKHCLYTLSHDEEIELGEYETKERALEVLDEIQTLLLGDVLLFKNFNVNSEDLSEIGNQLKTKVLGMVDVNNKDTDIKFIPRDCIVYEMPEE